MIILIGKLNKSDGLQTITFFILVSLSIGFSSFRNLSRIIIVSAPESVSKLLTSRDLNNGFTFITIAPMLRDPKNETGNVKRLGSINATLSPFLSLRTLLR